MKILYKYPTRQRPNKFMSCLDIYYQLMSGGDYEFVITLDSDDASMQDSRVKDYMSKKPNLRAFTGDNLTKIQAMNADIDKCSSWDILVLVQDDMIPQMRHFDDVIRQYMLREYPDTDGVLWFFDGYNRRINTSCIIGKKYYDRFGYIYHPSYVTAYCDNEFTEIANALNRQTFVDSTIIRHLHPINDRSTSWDALYEKNHAPLALDKENYARRKLNNFS
jgi:hypothetical protein